MSKILNIIFAILALTLFFSVFVAFVHAAVCILNGTPLKEFNYVTRS